MRLRLYLILVLCSASLIAADDLVFTPEPGVRVEGAAIPEASVDETGTTWLYYNVPGGERVTTAADGLNFPPGQTFTTYAHDPRNTRLPNGTFRRFEQMQLPINYDVGSRSSSDGVTFTVDTGVRYKPATGDNGTIGIVEVFSQKSGDVVMLYLGDLHGRNNTRRARSTDGGNTFTYEAGNILGDDNAGGGGNSYVDITTMLLPDGRRRLFAMKGGKGIYSFISSDDGQTFTQEAGARLLNTDFTGMNVIGMFDPSIVRLPDGRYRMYVAADVDVGGGVIAHRILSAITGATTPPPPPGSDDPTSGEQSLQIDRLKLVSNFGQPAKDSILLRARFELPEDVNLDGLTVNVNIGGAEMDVPLNQKGGARLMRRGTHAMLMVNTPHGTFASNWLDEGLTDDDARNLPVTMVVTISLNGSTFSGSKDLKYSARKGKIGCAR